MTVTTETVTYRTVDGRTFSGSTFINPAAMTRLTQSTTGFLGKLGDLTRKNAYNATTAGATIQGQYINGPLYVNAPNVTVADCFLDATNAYWGIEVGPLATGLVVKDTTTVFGASCGIMDDNQTPDVTFLRLSVTGGTDGIKLTGSKRLVQGCFIGALTKTATSHNDCIQASSGDHWRILGNTMECNDTGCVSIFEGQGTWDTILIQGNYLTGGGYPLYLGGKSATNVQVLGNVISGWGYGPYTDWPPASGTNVFSGNTDTTCNPIK